MIKKPNKPISQVSSYSPISLLPAISRIEEKNTQETKQKIIYNRNLFGSHNVFRNQRLTTHQLVRITEGIINQMNIAPSKAANFSDIEKAFGRVLHGGFLQKMVISKLDDVLLSPTLTIGFFKTRLEGVFSMQKTIKAEVP